MKRIGVWFAVLTFAISVTGCATAPVQPGYSAYPQRGQTPERISRDQYDCQALAQQQSGYNPGTEVAKGAGTGAVLGALGGAAAGAAIGAATGHAGKGAAIGAATGGIGGAVLGGSSAGAQNKEGYDRAYAVCMTGRGYGVR
jgi:hypothetical protein